MKEVRKWIPGNAHAGMKWLAARRPEVYRDQKNVKHQHQLSMDDAFLRFLDQMEERAKLERSQKVNVIELRPDVIEFGATQSQHERESVVTSVAYTEQADDVSARQKK